MTAAARARVPLLIGHFGGENAGDEAILDGTCRLLDAAGIRTARVVARRAGYRPVLTARCETETVPASAVAVVRATWHASAVVLCGGTHFFDDISLRRRVRHYRYLARYLAVVTLARALGRPVVALGQGVGPLVHPTGRSLARAFFRLVPAGTVRDDGSHAVAREHGAGRDWTCTIDTAFARPRAGRVAELGPVLTLAPVYGSRSAGTGAGDLAPLWDAFAGGLADVWDDLDLGRIDVLAVRTGKREADAELAAALARRLREVAPASLRLFSGSVDDIVDNLAGSSIVVCGRYHAFVFALLAGSVPIVLPTHQKLLDTAELVELPDALVVREATTGAMAKALLAAAEIDPLDLAPRVEELRERLVRDGLLVAGAVS